MQNSLIIHCWLIHFDLFY